MKKLNLILIIIFLTAVSAFAGELIIGGGFFNMGPGGGGGAEYEMDASGGSIILTGLTGQSFTYSGTTRTYLDGSGVMQDAAINTPRIEPGGLLLEPVGANIVLQSRNFDTSPWAAVGSINLSQNQTGVDGAANKAWIFDDDDSGSQEGIYYTLTVSSSARSYTVSLFVKKTVSASSFPGIGLVIQGSSTSVGQVIVNTDNGTLTDRTGNPPDDKGVVDAGDFWRVWITQADNDSGNTTLRIWVFAAVNTDASGDWLNTPEGSVVVDAMQLEYDTPYASSYIDNDGVAEGAEQSSGNLTVGKSYRITATAVDYFYTGCAVNDYFIAAAATALDASNKVTEFGTARASEAAALTYDLPSDLFAETLGSEEAPVFSSAGGGNWTEQAGWTENDGSATAVNVNGTHIFTTAPPLTVGELYKVTYTVVHTSGDGVRVRVGEGIYGAPHDTSDTFTEYIVCTGTTFLFFQGLNNWNGTISAVTVKQVTNAYDSGDGLAPPHGTAIVWWMPGYGAVGSTSAGILAVTNATVSLLWHGSTATVRTADGTTTPTVTLLYLKDTAYKLIVKHGYLSGNVAKFRIGYDSGSGVSWGTEQDYDGAYTIGANLIFGNSVTSGPYHNKRTWIYESILTDVEIDATPAP